MSDHELLARIVRARDEAAFEAVVRRYGAMVMSVGREILRDPVAADDLFQATFLVLWKNAADVREPEFLGRWLYGTAYRIAVRTKQQTARRRDRELAVAGSIAAAGCRAEGSSDPEELGLLHDELRRLPGRFREPIVLCHLEGLTYEDAARRLRCPLGTFKSRLGKGRQLLKSRLARRGVGVAAVLVWLRAARTAEAFDGGAVVPRVVEAARRSDVQGGATAATCRAVVGRGSRFAGVVGLLMGAVVEGVSIAGRSKRRRYIPTTLAGMAAAGAWLLVGFEGCAQVPLRPARARTVLEMPRPTAAPVVDRGAGEPVLAAPSVDRGAKGLAAAAPLNDCHSD